MSKYLALLIVLGSVALASAQAPPPDSLEALTDGLKPFLVSALPDVLYEKNTNWGHQEPTPNGLKWDRLKPHVTKSLKNDGVWRKLRITTQELPRTLELRLYDHQTVDTERQTFKVFLAFQAGVEYEKQTWES